MKAPVLAELRQQSRGRFLRLRAGLTHVVEEGPPDGAPLLLLHGATVPHWEFDRLVPLLRTPGWRIVRFDFFGHGLSDRPAVAYDFELFLGQALEVLNATDAGRPWTVLGHSFGAAIAAALATERATLVERLVLVAPLLDFMVGSFWPRVFALPGIGRVLMRHVGIPALERRRERRYAAIGATHLTPRFVAEARAAGYAEALASMFASGTLADQRARYRRLHEAERDILVIAGGADRVVPPQDVARVRALLPPHGCVEIPGAEHNLLLTHAEVVAGALVRDGLTAARRT